MSLYERLHTKEALRPAEPLRQAQDENLRQLRKVIQSRLVEEIDAAEMQKLVAEQGEKTGLRERIRELMREEMQDALGADDAYEQIVSQIIGFGPLQALLDDASVTEVMVNGRDDVYVERGGMLQRAPVTFESDAEIYQIIERIVAPLGRRIDESSPMVDARLPDGSRVNAIIPPLALRGPCLTIRKFPEHALGIPELVELGSLDDRSVALLQAAVRGRLNILIAGGTASGKTTLLNALSSFIPDGERIVTIEDAAELRLQQRHVVSLETRPANLEGRGEITIRQLVRNALRMRPDRIVVGEVRSGEALDMLQAMNTGHDGSLATVHANSPRDVLSRLETMVLMAGIDLPLRAVREQVAAAVQLVVQAARLRDGSRRVTHLTEIQGMEGDVIVLQDIFVRDGDLGELRPTGLRPRFLDSLRAHGVPIPEEVLRS